MAAKTSFWAVLLPLAIMGSGCLGHDLVGKYVVVDMDQTLAGIKDVPYGFSQDMSLQQYRDHLRKQYAGKMLKFTSKPPPSFVIPVPLEGAVQGFFDGGWARDKKDKRAILIYQWVSGSIYLPWGRATSSNNVLTVTLDGEGTNAAVLFLRKEKQGS